jgi:hypothetical protein
MSKMGKEGGGRKKEGGSNNEKKSCRIEDHFSKYDVHYLNAERQQPVPGRGSREMVTPPLNFSCLA